MMPFPHRTAAAPPTPGGEPAAVEPRAAHVASTLDRLRDSAHRAADRAVVRARAARELGATAAGYHAASAELERQACRADALLFGRAAETFRAAAAENTLVAEALEAMEREGSP